MTVRAKHVLRYAVGLAFVAVGLYVVVTEINASKALTPMTAGMGVGLAALGGLLVDADVMKGALATIAGTLRAVVRGSKPSAGE